MRAKSLLGFVVALIAVVALVPSSGSATTKAHTVGRIDVSSRAAVIRYLRSLHVPTKDVVIQRGAHNYAGARCPGRGWTCAATTHTIVQIAGRGGTNSFTCKSGSCRVLQVATAPQAVTQTAACVIRLTAQNQFQSCSIFQSSASANNRAIIYEQANASGAASESALVNASITQRATGAANSNTACVFQGINLDGSKTVSSGSLSVALAAHQTVTIRQDSAHGGNSASSSATSYGTCDTSHPLTQTQTLGSVAKGPGAITQNENSGNYGANVTLDIEQNQSSGFFGTAQGPNSAIFSQTNALAAVANSPHGPVGQTQSSVNGGILGTVNQDSRDPSTASATQTETQCEDAHAVASSSCDHAVSDAPGYSLTQTQFGPVRKGVGTATQTGNAGDNFTVNQSSTQDNDTGSGQTNVVQGDCSTAGNCTVSQNTNVNGQTTTNSQSGQNLNSGITCTGSSCQTTAPPTPSIDVRPSDPNYSTAVSFAFSDAQAGVTFLCQFDGAGYSPCVSPLATTLPYGPHTFSVEAKDSNGNVSNTAASYAWNNVPPAPSIDSSPANPSNSPEAAFAFSDSDNSLSLLCSLDGGPYSLCLFNQRTYTGLADGPHTFAVEATDGLGHTSSATSYTWTVDVFTWSGAQLTATNVDIGEFGTGGMRGGDGTGSIDVSGLSGTVLKAYLYWHGPTNSTDPNVNADVTFNGTPVTGVNIGADSDNNWGFTNSQAWRADVTSLVSGDGTYSLSDFVKGDADINGVALVVFYDDGNTSNDRNIVLWNGNDSNASDGVWDEMLTSVPYPGSGSASLDVVVADGQSYADGDLSVNNVVVGSGPDLFQGNTGPSVGSPPNPGGVTGSLWDLESFDVSSVLSAGTNTLHITSPAVNDALSLVVAIANTPVSGVLLYARPHAAQTRLQPQVRQQSAGLQAPVGAGAVGR